MAKKDIIGRVIIPEEIYKEVGASIFENLTYNPYFFYSAPGKIGITIDDNRAFTKLHPHLGICDYNRISHSIYLPENVECILGSQEFFFTIDVSSKPAILYINSIRNLKTSNNS